MAAMTKRERIEAALNHERPDRTPVFDIIANTRLIEHVTERQLTHENWRELESAAIDELLDMTRFLMPFRQPGVETTEEGFVVEHAEWTSWFRARPFTTSEEAAQYLVGKTEALRTVEYGGSYRRQFRQAYFEKTRHIDDSLFVATAVFDGLFDIYEVIGLELWSYLMIDAPDIVNEFIRVFFEKQIEKLHAEADSDLCPAAFIYSDIAYKDRLIFSTSYLEESGYFDRISTISDALHQHGLKVIYHSDGDIRSILKRLVGCGIDAINPVETAAGMRVEEIATEFGDRLSLVGGVDCSELLAHATPDRVAAETKRIIDVAGRNGGLLLGSTSELHNQLPVQNVMAMIETAWEH